MGEWSCECRSKETDARRDQSTYIGVIVATMSAPEVLAKWKAATSSAGNAYKAGVMAVTENPAAKAIQAIPKYQAGIQAAIDSGKLQRGLQRVTLQSWQQAAATTGATRLASGVQKGEQKMASFLQQFLPFQAAVTASVRSMPSTTPEEREARMLEQVRRTRTFQRTGG